nr:type 1 glutamine amidotransferase domain-containing protein [Acidisarcina polymorpha]
MELTEPRKALDCRGATTVVISPKGGEIRGWKLTDWGDNVPVDQLLEESDAQEFDALLLPGGVINPDKLRINPKAVKFVAEFVAFGKLIAAICHGPWTLIETGVVKGKTMTSWSSVKSDLVNAGANSVDQEVVVDGHLITSRQPDDIPAFSKQSSSSSAETRHNTRLESKLDGMTNRNARGNRLNADGTRKTSRDGRDAIAASSPPLWIGRLEPSRPAEAWRIRCNRGCNQNGAQ